MAGDFGAQGGREGDRVVMMMGRGPVKTEWEQGEGEKSRKVVTREAIILLPSFCVRAHRFSMFLLIYKFTTSRLPWLTLQTAI